MTGELEKLADSLKVALLWVCDILIVLWVYLLFEIVCKWDTLAFEVTLPANAVWWVLSTGLIYRFLFIREYFLGRLKRSEFGGGRIKQLGEILVTAAMIFALTSV